MQKVGLFIPCYVDQFYPQVGLATLRVLRRLGVDVEFPKEQTCCGQPMANSGCSEDARPLAERFLKIFGKYDYVVAPSGSCVSMVRNHYAQWLEGMPDFDHLRTGRSSCASTWWTSHGWLRLTVIFPLRWGCT
ncbi:MAG: (Fe-S)-binding protein [Terriglobales bacterium]